MTIDRRESYYIRSAYVRTVDPMDWHTRYMRGLKVLARMRRPLPARVDNVLAIRRVG